MSDGVTLGTTLAFGIGAVVMIAYYAWRSRQAGRVVPILVLAVAMIPLFWQEAPGDYAFFAQYNPHFAHVPDWGPLGMTHGGLPLIAIPGYPFYFIPPMVIALAVAKRLSRSRGWPYGRWLLLSGLVVGFCWDVPFEIVATRLGIWRLAHAPSGLTLFGGTKYQVSFAISLVIAITCMWCTYLIGRTDDNGEDVVLGWARTKTTNSRTARLLHLAVMAGVFQVIYFVAMLPQWIANLGGLMTYSAPEPLFGDIPIQTTPGTHDGPAGFLVLVGGFAVCVALTLGIVNRVEKRRLMSLCGDDGTTPSPPAGIAPSYRSSSAV